MARPSLLTISKKRKPLRTSMWPPPYPQIYRSTASPAAKSATTKKYLKPSSSTSLPEQPVHLREFFRPVRSLTRKDHLDIPPGSFRRGYPLFSNRDWWFADQSLIQSAIEWCLLHRHPTSRFLIMARKTVTMIKFGTYCLPTNPSVH